MAVGFILGYRVHEFVRPFTPKTVLFSKETDEITVSMVDDALNYVLSIIAIHDPLTDAYKKARTVFRAVRLILMNKQPIEPDMQDVKIAIDVLEEIINSKARSVKAKEDNARWATICRLIINRFYRTPAG